MLQKILVPLDGSGFGEQSVPLAASIARHAHVPMELLHVHVPHPPVHILGSTAYQWEGADISDYDREDAACECAYLNYVANKIRPAGEPDVRCVMLEGEVPEAIHAYAEATDDGLILMSTHGRTGLSRAWLGSVADTVVRYSPIPVLLLRASESTPGSHDPPTDFKRILIALDGSKRAERALGPTTEIAKAFGTTVKLFHVLRPGVRLGADLGEDSNPHAKKVVARAFDYLERIALGLREKGLEVTEGVVDSTRPAEAILEAIHRDEIDLVALATRGREGVQRAMLGSVADKVLRGAHVPMLVVGPA
jgi:nucleotide-binding universal stress UspA family protein